MPRNLTTDLPPITLRGRSALPVVQGGMGVGVSAHRLAGSVAREGAVGTLSAVDLRRHHPDLMEATGKSRDKAAIDEANRVALDREVKAALAIAGGNGIVAVNVMRAISEYATCVRQSCESGAQAVVVGAGLPLDLPELTAEHPGVALVPILSDARGIGIVLKKWMRKNRLPDAIVIEHPGHAGGHLGAAKVEDLHDRRFDFEVVLEATFKLFRELGLAAERIPLIVAGGIATPQRVRELLGLGASAVQLGTAFAVTEEGDAHPTFKKVLAEAKPEDIVEFVSVAGLPARAVKTPWLAKYLEKIPVMERRRKPRTQCTLAFDCLQACGLRDGIAKFGQFCIDLHLAAALEGNLDRGLFFRGGGRLPFGDRIRPVRELLDYLLAKPEPNPA
ncbi:MAG: nitronate monooxygenase family protein [Burkholderiales bacterium]|nr:nitronate monooxygenase family protein [Burkholderiales bacterium]MCL4688906.1 nitronate monooxygenase family protein [Burkholderiales bacterium]